MRYSTIGLLAALASTALAQDPSDLLFIETLLFGEYVLSTQDLGFTADVVDEATWRNMTTEQFAQYKAIVISDPDCGDISNIKFLEDTRTVWSPAVTGNMIVIGTDPTRHLGTGGAEQLIKNSVQFAAAGVDVFTGDSTTGLYFALSCYYNDVVSAPVLSLDQFGDFTVRGNLSCYNDIHLVAQSAAIDSLEDADLSNFQCSVHEAFASYPQLGVNGFDALAIARNVLGEGSQAFADGSIGLPYIISRGASPVACGDGNWDATYGEECDDGNLIPGDGCSASCRCESNVPNGDGTCGPAVCGDGILSPGEQCDDGNTDDGDGCSSTCLCESGVPNGDGTCSPGPNTTTLTSTSIVVATSTSLTVSTSVSVSVSVSTSVTLVSSTLAGTNQGTGSSSTSSGSSSSSSSSGSAVGPGQVSTVIESATTTATATVSHVTLPPYGSSVYIKPVCPTTSKIIGCEVIVHVSTDGPNVNAYTTMQKPIYDYQRSDMPCYVCEMSSEGIYPTAGGYGFMTVTTTACPYCEGGALPTPALPVIYTSPGCAAQTLTTHAPWEYQPTSSDPWAIPYVTPSAHYHQQPAPTGDYEASYPTATAPGGYEAPGGYPGGAESPAAGYGAGQEAPNGGNNAYGAPSVTGGAAPAPPYPSGPAGGNNAYGQPGVAGTGTGAGKPYPTNTAMAFEGGASAFGVAFGAVGGAILGLAALL